MECDLLGFSGRRFDLTLTLSSKEKESRRRVWASLTIVR
jgi:hypothetical protein